MNFSEISKPVQVSESWKFIPKRSNSVHKSRKKSWSSIMSIFFFRFHNLRRAEEKRKKQTGTTKSRRNMDSDTLTTPSRLLERPLSEPVDSLDEIALQIPRCPDRYIRLRFICVM